MQINSVTAAPAATAYGPTKRAEAATSTSFEAVMGAATPRQTFANLTDDDRQVLAAATGVQMDSQGNVVSSTTSDPDMGPFLQMQADRQFGQLQGPVTSSYVEDLIARIPEDNSVAQAVWNRALDFLLARESEEAKRVDVRV